MDDASVFHRLREEERAVRRRLIIEACRRLLSEKPFDAIGMRDIAAEAGISPASLYRYFPSQADLFIETFLYDLQELARDFDRGVRRSGAECLEDMAVKLVDHLIDNEATFQMMSYLMIRAEIPEAATERFNALMRIFLHHVDDVIEPIGIASDLRLFSQSFFASLIGILMTYRNYPGRDREEIRRHIRKLAVMVSRIFKQGAPSISVKI